VIANTSRLRLLAIRRTTSSNSADHRLLDLPIVAWRDDGGRLVPVVVAALDPDDLLRLFDPDQKVWYSLTGERFESYAAASREAWAEKPSEAAPALTEPSIGPVAEDAFGVGQTPSMPRWRVPSSVGGDPPRHR